MPLKSFTRKLAGMVALLFAAMFAAHAQGRSIYSDTADAHADIHQALATAAKEHKNVILDFGGNWCGDCQVLDIYFHQIPNLGLLNNNYVLVNIDVGRFDRNTDIAAKYGVPVQRGVPALAVLDSHGKLIYRQKTGEAEAMSRQNPEAVTAFLEQWKPKH